MPVRKRRSRRKPAAGPEEWFCAFESEFDLFSDLAGLVELDSHGRPDRDEAKAAWRLHGEAFLADFAAKYPRGAHFVPWALREFGEVR
jgi:hypothetical protein